MKSLSAMVFVVGLLVPGDILAQYRIMFEPSIKISEVHDDNLFFSAEEPASDLIFRAEPALELRFESERWAAVGTYGFDSERFADHSHLTKDQARERALITLRYKASPRLTFALEGANRETANAAELNEETGLATSRVGAQRLSFGPSVRFQLSPRSSARASYFAAMDRLTGGSQTRTQSLTAGIDRQATTRDLFTLDLEQTLYRFGRDAETSSTNLAVVRVGWSRQLGLGESITLQAGPRFTDGSAAPELAASYLRRWKNISMAVSCRQTETTLIGSTDTVEAHGLDAMFTYAPTPFLTAFVSPGIIRTSQDDLEATVYRFGLGARYAFTSLIGVEANYNLDSQRGAIDPSMANAKLTHGILSVGLNARWNAHEGARR